MVQFIWHCPVYYIAFVKAWNIIIIFSMYDMYADGDSIGDGLSFGKCWDDDANTVILSVHFVSIVSCNQRDASYWDKDMFGSNISFIQSF